MDQINCIVVTPERTALETQADFVALPLYDGELGVLPGHSPLIGRLGFGELRLRSGGEVQRYYIDGGFVQVLGDVVSVLTSRAIPAHQLDVQAAQQQLDSARLSVAPTGEQQQARQRLIDQARGQLEVARRERGG